MAHKTDDKAETRPREERRGKKCFTSRKRTWLGDAKRAATVQLSQPVEAGASAPVCRPSDQPLHASLAKNGVCRCRPKAATTRRALDVIVGVVPEAADPTGEVHVAGHDCDALGVYGAQVGVHEEVDDVVFGGVLEGVDGVDAPAEVRVKLDVGDLLDEAGKGEAPD